MESLHKPLWKRFLGANGNLPTSVPDAIRFPIRLKITMPYLILALLIAFGVGLLSVRVIFENVDERFSSYFHTRGNA